MVRIILAAGILCILVNESVQDSSCVYPGAVFPFQFDDAWSCVFVHVPRILKVESFALAHP